MARRRRSGMVAIVVPWPAREELRSDEDVSLRHLCHYLGAHDKYLIAPAGSRVRRTGFATVQVPRKFFGSAAAHGNLMMWPRFYRLFQGYEYLFVYHLDSLVFSDDLLTWCRAGFDYIGPPWVPCPETPWVTEARVGNGGCTLMRVASVRRVLRNRHRQEPLTRVLDLVARNARALAPLYALLERTQRRWPTAIVDRFLQHGARARDPATHGLANDWFWSIEAARYTRSFRVAPVEEALQFAFEAAPRACFARNGRRLPFGCHAWPKFDRAFWEPFLLPEEADGASAARSGQRSGS